MRTMVRCLVAALALESVPLVGAQTFATLEDDAISHVASGWIFARQIGEFERIEAPVVVEGTSDVAAGYRDSRMMTATVYVYPPTTIVGDAKFEGAKAVIERDLAKEALAQIWSEGPFRVGTTPPLLGAKAFYKVGLGPDSWQTNVYVFETGPWIVKVRITGPSADQGVFQRADGFVREQRWDSLGLTAATCSGVACNVARVTPIHASLPETLARLLVDQTFERVFPRDMPDCDAASLHAAFGAASRTKADGTPEVAEIVASCVPRPGYEASFVRLALSADVLSRLELESPDGLSLRGPISFAVLGDGKKSVFTEMRDGALSIDDVTALLTALAGDERADFATANRNGKQSIAIITFIE